MKQLFETSDEPSLPEVRSAINHREFSPAKTVKYRLIITQERPVGKAMNRFILYIKVVSVVIESIFKVF
jgi:hypothetical protein